jgi:hypothetical protein
MTAVAQTAPFNLLRWFAWLSPLVIALIALANALAAPAAVHVD